MNRDELRAAIRNQTDIDVEDVSDATLDLYLREGFDRTAVRKHHWPDHQASWEYNVSTPTVALATDTKEITAIILPDNGYERLQYLDHDWAETQLSSREGKVVGFSIWAGLIYLWPNPDQTYKLAIRGWRKPSYDWLADPALEVDIDSRLHLALIHYAVGLVYLSQEDPQIAGDYMRAWDAAVEATTTEIVHPHDYAPQVLNGGITNGRGWASMGV